MKNFDCNQIKIFINLEIIREENMNKNIYTYFSFNLKKKKFAICNEATRRNHNL